MTRVRVGSSLATAVLFLTTFAGRSVAGDVEILDLKDGHQVKGEILAEKASAYYVDLGFDVVRVPKDQVIARRKPGTEPAAPVAMTSDADPKGFYKVIPGKVRPVKDLVREFGEG